MAYRSHTVTIPSDATADPYNAPAPTGVASGDIVLVLIAGEDDLNCTVSGFTEGGRIATGGGVYVMQWFWKVATGSEPANYSVDPNFSAGKWTYVVAFSGRNTTTPITASASTAIGSLTATPVTIDATGVTAASGDDIVWWPMTRHDFSDRWDNYTPPTNYTEAAQNGDWPGFGTSFAYRENVSGGSTGTLSGSVARTSGTTAGARVAAWVIALAASAGSSSPKRTLLLGVG